jgi:mannose-6-phosphate isomerase-like protein (cupin superfamily)
MKPIFMETENHEKGWGNEIWIVNNELYCGKILQFNKNAKFSMHYHTKKDETWYVLDGNFMLKYINGENADIIEKKLLPKEVLRILPGCCHQLECLSEQGGQILEISTQHIETDSYRVMKGDSQK